VHTSFVELAVENPDIDFVIKHKGVNWSKTKFLLENLDAYNIRNLHIYDLSYDSQELILTSDVVTGFCSTSLLEAAIAEKPVIYPLFSEAADEQYRDFVCFDNAPDIFDIATNSKEFKKIIIERYKKPEISKKSKELRVLQFEDQVSSIASNASSEYSKILKRLACNKRLS
jgi:lipid A disaccharide synthetase